MHQWNITKDLTEASQAAADFLQQTIETSLMNKNQCHIILPGGNTPAQCLAMLLEKDLPWHQLHWYLGDERCFPQGHEERNDVMIQKSFYGKINNSHFYPIPAELGAEKAAEQYAETIASVTAFDIAFLGMGEDGHTASLFPGNSALQDKRSVVAVHNAPKPPAGRVSMGLSTLLKTQCRMVLSAGAAKSEILQRIKRGDDLPINQIGDIHWFVDEAAMTETV